MSLILLLRGALALGRAIPDWVWQSLAVVGIAAAIYATGWVQGAGHVQDQWTAEQQSTAVRLIKIQAAQAAVTNQIQTRVVYRERVIHDQAQAIAQEIPTYVTPQTDAACPVPTGFVRLWNHANTGTPAGPASSAVAAPSGVVLSDIEAEHNREADYFRQLEQQVIGWQDWFHGMQQTEREN